MGDGTGLPTDRRTVLRGLGASVALGGLGAVGALGPLSACSTGSTPDGAPGAGGTAGGAPSGSGPVFAPPAELRSVDGRLEVDLVAVPATVTTGVGERYALTYNGSVPGPTLRIRPGDDLVVTLENRLDQPTNLHTHGLHVSPDGDSDNIFVMVAPGERHTYRYAIPADHPGGTFWYHPHHHGDVARQLFGGMAGAIVVEDADDAPGGALAGTVERVLVLADPRAGDSAAALDATMMQKMLGREGDLPTVNGLVGPVLTARTGTVERWRLVNASPSRFYRLTLDGHPFHVVAADHGRFAEAVRTDEIRLVPGERLEVLVAVDTPGDVALRAHPVDRGGMGGMGSGGRGGGMGNGAGGVASTAVESVLLTLRSEGEVAAVAVPTVIGSPTPLPTAADATRELVLSMAMGPGGGGMGGGGSERFMIDGRTFDGARTDITVRLGTVEDWTIRNTSPMDHPFHLHVWPFRVLGDGTDAGVSPGWKDTVNVPANGAVTVRVAFADIPGRAVYHCHILDHEDLGMMATIEVRPG